MEKPIPANSPIEFEQQLTRIDAQYELLSPLDALACHLRFTGPFQGKQLIWDAHLQTLAYYVREHSLQDQDVRQFIEIGKTGELGRSIKIALNLPIIDQPAVLKTIIMIRQYKRLASGRHEFGDTVNIAI